MLFLVFQYLIIIIALDKNGNGSNIYPCRHARAVACKLKRGLDLSLALIHQGSKTPPAKTRRGGILNQPLLDPDLKILPFLFLNRTRLTIAELINQKANPYFIDHLPGVKGKGTPLPTVIARK